MFKPDRCCSSHWGGEASLFRNTDVTIACFPNIKKHGDYNTEYCTAVIRQKLKMTIVTENKVLNAKVYYFLHIFTFFSWNTHTMHGIWCLYFHEQFMLAVLFDGWEVTSSGQCIDTLWQYCHLFHPDRLALQFSSGFLLLKVVITVKWSGCCEGQVFKYHYLKRQ